MWRRSGSRPSPSAKRHKTGTTDTTSSPKRPATPTNKDVCRLFFGKAPVDEAEDIWLCKCGKKYKCNVKTSGYENLIKHLRAAHPDYQMQYNSAVAASSLEEVTTANLDSWFDEHATKIYNWLE